jgi:hypothetical protein
MAVIKFQRAGGEVVDEIDWQAEELQITERRSGPGAAAFLAGGIGALVLGVLTTLNEASTEVHDFLEFWQDVGPLSGKTLIASAAFAGSWIVLALILWRRNVSLNAAFALTAFLIVLGFVGTFPKFFELFAD